MKEEKTENLKENSTIDYVQQVEKAYTSLLEQIEELKVQENYVDYMFLSASIFGGTGVIKNLIPRERYDSLIDKYSQVIFTEKKFKKTEN